MRAWRVLVVWAQRVVRWRLWRVLVVACWGRRERVEREMRLLVMMFVVAQCCCLVGIVVAVAT